MYNQIRVESAPELKVTIAKGPLDDFRKTDPDNDDDSIDIVKAKGKKSEFPLQYYSNKHQYTIKITLLVPYVKAARRGVRLTKAVSNVW
ncbi:MAG: hypothetical protein M3258_08225 [Thermoproteota archaeon]|nr:hypothetical protein [Thermoproteota archaeon]